MRVSTRIAPSCAACLLGYVLVLAAASAQPPAPPAGLHASVGQIHARGTALADVIDQLRGATGQDIFVNWRALGASRVTRDLPVTLDLSNLSLDQALERLLDHVGGPYVRLGFTVDQGVVAISCAVDLSKNTSTRVYDVRAAIKDGPTRAADVKAIIRRVEGIDPLPWKDSGGEMGAVNEVGGQLIVTATPDIQSLVAQELSDLLPPTVPGAVTR